MGKGNEKKENDEVKLEMPETVRRRRKRVIKLGGVIPDGKMEMGLDGACQMVQSKCNE